MTAPPTTTFQKMELTSSSSSSEKKEPHQTQAEKDAHGKVVSDRATAVCSSIDETLKRAAAVTSGCSELDRKWAEFQGLFQKMNEKLVQNLSAILPFGGFEQPQAEWMIWHGRLGKESWPLPVCVSENENLSRPKYTSVDCSEYKEANERVLDEKITMLAQLLKSSKHAVLYTGAGISTAANIADYASGSTSTVVTAEMKKQRLTKSFIDSCKPTYAHRVFAHLVNKGVIPFWLQQNHDRLAQKAGVRRDALCAIHGEVGDPSNPVVPMKETLRPDLCQWMQSESKKADCTISVGTSLSGMASDGCAKSTARKFLDGTSSKATQKDKDNRGNGLCIVAIQRTQMDQYSSLRIFAKADDVAKRLAKKLAIEKDLDLKTIHPVPEIGYEWIPADGKRIEDDREFVQKKKVLQNILAKKLTEAERAEFIKSVSGALKTAANNSNNNSKAAVSFKGEEVDTEERDAILLEEGKNNQPAKVSSNNKKPSTTPPPKPGQQRTTSAQKRTLQQQTTSSWRPSSSSSKNNKIAAPTSTTTTSSTRARSNSRSNPGSRAVSRSKTTTTTVNNNNKSPSTTSPASKSPSTISPANRSPSTTSPASKSPSTTPQRNFLRKNSASSLAIRRKSSFTNK